FSSEGEEPPDHRFERMETEVKSRRHPEVAAPPAEAPEEVGILIGSRPDHAPVRSDDLSTDQVVARETVLGGQVADTSSERKPAHAGRANDASWRDKAVRLRGRIKIEPGRSAARARDPLVRIYVYPPHGRADD